MGKNVNYIKKEVEIEERQALEKLSNIGEVGVLERMKEFENLEKKIKKNILFLR